MYAFMCLQTFFFEAFEVAEKLLIILSHWLVLTSFYEADWWHFTDPSNTGISMKAIVIILCALFIPTVLFQIKRFVLGKNIHFIILFFLKVCLAILLLLSSLPVFLSSPWVRTGVLALGVGLSPILLTIVLSYRSWPKSWSKKGCLSSRETCLSVEQSNSLELETDKSQFLKDKSKSRDSHSEAMLLVAVLLSMLLRWSFATINIFYESWQASFVLLICLAFFAFLSTFQTRKRFNNRFRKSYGSASTHTEIVMSADVDHTPSSKLHTMVEDGKVFQNRSSVDHRNSLVKLTSLPEDDDTSRSDSPLPFEKPASDRNCFPYSLRVVLLFLAGAVQGFALGMLLVFSLWMFSTPNLLVRWSGENPSTHGPLVIVFFTVGIIFSICAKNLLDASSHYSKVALKGKFKCEQVSYWFLDVLVLGLSIGLLICAAILQIQGSKSPSSFVGSAMFCIALPCCFTINLVGIKRLLRLCNYLHVTPLFLSCCLSVIAFFAGLSFLVSHVILVLFVNPQITMLFLGRMDIILAYLVLVIVASLTISTIINRIFHICQREVYKNCRSDPFDQSNICNDSLSFSYSFCQRATLMVLLLFCLVFITLGCSIRPVFTARQCLHTHKDSLQQVMKFYGSSNYSTNTFSVLSWNILLGHDKYGKDNMPCVAETLQLIQPDIIGLEESEALPPYWGGKDIPAYLSNFLGIKTYLGVHPLKSSLGVAFLTNRPVTKHHSYLLPVFDSDKLPHYSLVRIDTIVNNHSVTIFNVHAVYKNWTATKNNVCPFANTSKKQMNFIAQKVLAIDQTQPIVIMGDFNLNPNESQLDILHKLGFQSALHRRRDLRPPSTLRNRFAVVDHIFYRGLILSESRTVIETEDISDHNPVIAYFRLPT